MDSQMAIEKLKAASKTLEFLARELNNVVDCFESMESEKPEPVKEPEQERHKWTDSLDLDEINQYTWSTVMRGFAMHYDIKPNNLCVEDFSLVTERELMRWRGMGKLTLERVKNVMGKYGVKFKGEE